MPSKLARYASVLTISLLVVLSIFPLIIANRYPVYLNDDSYITLTYVKNLVNGNGFVFNHPPAVLGTTTPFLVITLTFFANLLHSLALPKIVVFVNAICWIGVMWTFYFFRNEWGLRRWQVCVLAVVLIGTGWVRILEMEMYLFAFLLILSLSLLLRKKYWLSGFFTSLLFLTRGEGALVLPIAFITIFIEHWVMSRSVSVELLKKWLYLAIGFALPVIVWEAYAYSTFGTFLPNTLAGKLAQAQSGLWSTFWHRLVLEWAPTWGAEFSIKSAPFINFWWIICLFGLATVVIKKPKWLLLIGWIILYILGYSILNVAGYGWYQYPILFVMSLLFALGIITIVELIGRYLPNKKIAWALSLIAIMGINFLPNKATANSALTFKGDARGVSYMALSQWFRDNTEPSKSIAYIEIGYLGYYSDNRIIDLAGLVLPDSTSHIENRDFSWIFWNYQPDYYVYLPDFDWALGSIKADPRFDQQYQAIAILQGPRTTDFVIYKRIKN